MDKARLWLQCDLYPIFSGETSDKDAADILKERFGQRIAEAIRDVLLGDENVGWNNSVFDIELGFYRASELEPSLLSRATEEDNE